ncbi:MAG TPA: sigma-70 family RNA polymerase sigma factor [Chthonomonadales bacterium]|nr:sigma-70 family RNA polymerase sigma factor [Chthonomonadales bacterium]
MGYSAVMDLQRAALPTEVVATGSLRVLADDELIRLCSRGEQAALAELARRYQTPIYRFLLRMTGSHEDAEECALDVFVRAWRHAARFEFRCRVGTWLYRIAANIARDAYSRRKCRPQEPWPSELDLARMATGSAEEDALAGLDRERLASALNAALSKLKPIDRTVLVLYYLEQRDYDEIQQITELSYSVLKTRLARARRRLRVEMEKSEFAR